MRDLIAAFIRGVEAFNIWIGRTASWLYPILMLVIVLNVVLRYGFSSGSIMMEEIQWHLYSTAFLLGLAYTYAEDAHVRVDIVYGHLNPRRQAWIDFLGSTFLLLPFAGFLAWDSWPYLIESWNYGERSEVPSGLPGRYVIKFILFVGMFLLMLQAIATSLKKMLFLLGLGASPAPATR